MALVGEPELDVGGDGRCELLQEFKVIGIEYVACRFAFDIEDPDGSLLVLHRYSNQRQGLDLFEALGIHDARIVLGV